MRKTLAQRLPGIDVNNLQWLDTPPGFMKLVERINKTKPTWEQLQYAVPSFGGMKINRLVRECIMRDLLEIPTICRLYSSEVKRMVEEMGPRGEERIAIIEEIGEKEFRLAVINRDHVCVRCGGPGTDVHHLLSRRHHKSRFDAQNGVLLCRPCHDWAHKATKFTSTWLATAREGALFTEAGWLQYKKLVLGILSVRTKDEDE